jgi:hypothetical protein
MLMIRAPRQLDPPDVPMNKSPSSAGYTIDPSIFVCSPDFVITDVPVSTAPVDEADKRLKGNILSF